MRTSTSAALALRSGLACATSTRHRVPAAAAAVANAQQHVRTKKTSAKSAVGSVSDKSAALAMAIRQIESSFGKGSVMQLGSTKIAEKVEVISSGSLSLDLALGVGGLPKGRVVEIYGPESSGKTTLALSCIAEAQKQGGVCAFIDAEHAIDAHYAKALGVNIDELYISQPDSGEEALEIADTLIRSGAVELVVVDSVAALVPRAELEGEMGDQQIALQARLMSQALRKLTGSLSKSNCMIIFLNQIRQKVGILFGSPEVTSGGTALRYYASVRLDIRRKAAIKEGDKIVGNEIVVKVAKNKMASPFKVANFDMMFGKGIDRYSELLDLGVREGLLKRSGAWYAIVGREEPIGQGKAKAKVFLEENPEIAAEIEAKLRQRLFDPEAEDTQSQDGAVDDDSVMTAVDADEEGEQQERLEVIEDEDAVAFVGQNNDGELEK
uniref:RecA protein n=1 Tax=Globisporangium ultimum (strain ATCC 200006 / CBS 805.95 / DAOM BR144) TaxID=431595 RepID=K3X0G0_GLOUD